MAKRAMDIAGAVFGLLFLCPLLPFIVIAIVIDSGFPIFVRLPRVSDGHIIRVHKFRTMVKNAQELKESLLQYNERSDGPFFKMKDDPRVTKIGRLLRRFRLDEFPQFWDVLRGDLALVGPRPHEQVEVEQYPPQFQRLTFAKAGLTGLSQIMGASSLPFLKEVELDIYYLDHPSFWFDLKILFKTVTIFFSDPTGV